MAERRNSSESDRKNISVDEEQKKAILDRVANSERPTAEILRELGISRSTYYSWLNRFKTDGESGLIDKRTLSEQEIGGSDESPSMVEPPGTTAAENHSADFSPVEPPEEPAVEKEPAAEKEPGDVPPASPEEPQPSIRTAQQQETQKEGVGLSTPSSQSGGGSKKTNVSLVATIAIIFIIAGLVVSLCMYNSSKYYIAQDGTKITLWKGKFAPFGKEQVTDFAPIDVGALQINTIPTKTFFGEWGAVNGLFEYLIGRADAMLAKTDGPDYAEANKYLNVAEKVAFKGEQRTALNKRYARLYETIAVKRVVQTEQQLAKMYEDSIDILQRASMLNADGDEAVEQQIRTMQAKLNELRKWNFDYKDSWLSRRNELETLLQSGGTVKAKAVPDGTAAAPIPAPPVKAEEKPAPKAEATIPAPVPAQAKPEVKNPPQAELKAAPKPEAAPAAKPEAKPAANTEPKPEAKAPATAAPKPAATGDVKAPAQAKTPAVSSSKVPSEAAERALEQVQSPRREPLATQPVAIK